MTIDTQPAGASIEALQAKLAQVEARLAEVSGTAELLSALIDAIGEAVILYDPQGNPARANARAAEFCGFDPASRDYAGMIAALVLRRMDGSLVPTAELPSRFALRGERLVEQPYRLTNSDGRERILRISAAPVYQNGALMGVVTTWRDVTEHEQLTTERDHAEQALRLSREAASRGLAELRSIYTHAPIGLCFFDTELRYQAINETLAQINRLPAEEHIGKTFREVLPDDIAAAVEAGARQALESGQPVLDQEISSEDQRRARHWLVSFQPVFSQAGLVVGLSCVVQDITLRKQAEEALLRYALISENTRDIILFMDREDGRILEANQAAVAAYGYSRDELLALPVHALRAADTLALTAAQMEQADSAGILFETVHMRKDGSIFPVEVSSRGATVHGRRTLISVVRDITERKTAEAGLEGQVRMTQAINRLLSEAMHCETEAELRAVYDRIVDADSGQANSLTYESALAPAMEEALQRLHAEQALRASDRAHRELAETLEVERAKLTAAIEHLPVGLGLGDAKGNVFSFNAAGLKLHDFESEAELFSRLDQYIDEFELRYPDGRLMPVEEWPASLAMRGVFVRDYETILINKVKGTQRVLSYSVAPVRNPAGETVLVTYVMQDMTERKQAEQALRESEATLRDYAQRLEHSNHDLQEFAYVASHDLQEPLRKIEVFSATLLSNTAGLGEGQRDYLERVQSAAKRMRLMIDGLLTLSRVTTQGHPFEPVDLSEVAAEVVSDLEIRFRRSGGQVEIGPLPQIEADPLQMRQLFLNLIGNALKYHEAGQPPVIRLSATQGAGRVEIEVADDGIGFDPVHAEEIFQPFKRLVGRSEYEGAGMGLAICRKIVERHGGTLTASSQPGQGARFIVCLPEKQV